MAISEFEKSAQKAAVEAVERRWKHDADLKRRLRWRARIGGIISIAVLLLGLAGIGVFAERQFGFHIPYLSDCEVWRSLCTTSENAVRKICPTERAEAPEKPPVPSYAEALAAFRGKTCTSWERVSAQRGPKAAAAGTRYLFLCGYGPNDVRLYQMTVDEKRTVDVVRLMQAGEPRPIEFASFRAEVKGRTSFLSCDGAVYFLGKKLAATAQIELDRLLGKRR